MTSPAALAAVLLLVLVAFSSSIACTIAVNLDVEHPTVPIAGALPDTIVSSSRHDNPETRGTALEGVCDEVAFFVRGSDVLLVVSEDDTVAYRGELVSLSSVVGRPVVNGATLLQPPPHRRSDDHYAALYDSVPFVAEARVRGMSWIEAHEVYAAAMDRAVRAAKLTFANTENLDRAAERLQQAGLFAYVAPVSQGWLRARPVGLADTLINVGPRWKDERRLDCGWLQRLKTTFESERPTGIMVILNWDGPAWKLVPEDAIHIERFR